MPPKLRITASADQGEDQADADDGDEHEIAERERGEQRDERGHEFAGPGVGAWARAHCAESPRSRGPTLVSILSQRGRELNGHAPCVAGLFAFECHALVRVGMSFRPHGDEDDAMAHGISAPAFRRIAPQSAGFHLHRYFRRVMRRFPSAAVGA